MFGLFHCCLEKSVSMDQGSFVIYNIFIMFIDISLPIKPGMITWPKEDWVRAFDHDHLCMLCLIYAYDSDSSKTCIE